MQAGPGGTFYNDDLAAADTSSPVLASVPLVPFARPLFFPTLSALFPPVLVAVVAIFLSVQSPDDAARAG
jgi:hypothetical protein